MTELQNFDLNFPTVASDRMASTSSCSSPLSDDLTLHTVASWCSQLYGIKETREYMHMQHICVCVCVCTVHVCGVWVWWVN